MTKQSQQPVEWLPSHTLVAPDEDWPTDSPNNSDAFAASSVFSPLLPHSASNDHWDYYNWQPREWPWGYPVAAAYCTQVNSQVTIPTTTTYHFREKSQPFGVSFIPVPHTKPSATLIAQGGNEVKDSEEEDLDGDSYMTDEKFSPNASSSQSTMDGASPRTPLKATWGSFERLHESFKHIPDRQSTRTKTAESFEPRRESKHPSSPLPNTRQLRGVKPRPRMTLETSKADDYLPPARVSHNLVEKQYRNRLNSQFSGLLESLPPSFIGAVVDSSELDKKLSKGEVLVFAKKYIKKLEREKDVLEAQSTERDEEILRMRAEWATKIRGSSS